MFLLKTSCNGYRVFWVSRFLLKTSCNDHRVLWVSRFLLKTHLHQAEAFHACFGCRGFNKKRICNRQMRFTLSRFCKIADAVLFLLVIAIRFASNLVSTRLCDSPLVGCSIVAIFVRFNLLNSHNLLLGVLPCGADCT